jgi:hypothetical protein
MASLSALAEYPTMIKDIFLTKVKNKAGIHAVTFYIRGKPWVVDVDDSMLFMWPNVRKPKLKMAQPSKTGEMWAPIIEKAWAKVKGSYQNADGGLIENGLRALTGSPVYIYEGKNMNTEKDIKELF